MGLETPQELEQAGGREASGHPALGAGLSANQSGGEAPHPANAEAKAEMDADEAAREKQRRKQSSTGQVMEVPPMDEYLCPISGDVMDDPVTIASGHTFDLKSIQRFFDEGNKHCPVTQEALENLEMTRNEDMARSIDEWRARNTVMRIQAARPKLQSAKEEEVEGGLLELFQLCEERATNRYWVAAEGLIPVVVNLLKSTSRNLRRKTLATLANLANGNDENKYSLSSTFYQRRLRSQQGAIPPLVTMIASGKLEAKAAALGALQNLSSLAANRNELIRAGVVPPLLTLLFSVTSVVMSLKEGAAAILANISMAAGAQAETRIDGNGAILESEETIFQLLSLMNLAGPNIQVNLLKALLGMASVQQAMEVRNRMIVGGAVDVLIPFIDGSEGGPATRPLAARVLRELSKEAEAGRSVAGSLMENQAAALKAIIAMLHDKDNPDHRAAAAGLMAALPPTDAKLNQALVQADVVQTLVTMLGMKGGGVGTNAQLKDAALEGAANALVRFTLPSNIKQQQQLAELGAIPQLVTLLVTGNAGAKRGAALCLGNFSESSPTLSVSVKAKSGGCCFKAPEEPKCVVHGGTCSVRASFCLLEAEAIDPLVGAMGEKDPLTAEAALTALSTLMADSCRWEASVKIIHESGGFGRVVQQLSEGTERAKEKGVWMLEKLFRLEEYKFEYATKAQGALIEITQHGSNETKPVAAKILSHLELLHQQSSYF
ncbi:unnamed protein product [Closterium sp. NIES-53]